MNKPTSTTTQSYDLSEPRRDQAGEAEEEDVDVNVSVDDMGKLRAGSISPSAYSTASSGSPLVRNHWGSSCQRSFIAPTMTTTTRARPALRPTSIAAAQLECQQRQRLEFSNQINNNNNNKLAANNSNDQGGREDAAKMSKRQKAMAKEQQALADASGQQRDADKGLAYRLAKSMAFKAYRFNQFWSVNKLSYMNLVCLLMTLVCLVTILTFSGKGGSGAINNGNVFAASEQKRQQLTGNSRKALANNDDSSSQHESLDSLDSQALRQQPDDQFDEFSPISAGEQPERRAGKFKRKSAEQSLAGSLQNRLSAGEREFSTTPTGAQLPGAGETGDAAASSSSSSSNNQEPTTTMTMTTTTTTTPITTSTSNAATAPTSLVEPILSQLFNDLELGSLIKAAIRRAGNATLNGKPVVRRTKNGATIIISSSSFNDSAPFAGQQAALLNETSPLSLPSLLDKLIPPMLRPAFPLSAASMSPTTTIIESGIGGMGGGITISGPALVNREPIFGASSSSFPRFGPLEMASSPFAASGRFRPLFSVQPFAEPLPAGHFRSPVPPPPFGSLFSMMMRAGGGGGGQASPLSLIDELIDSDDGPPMLVAQLGPQVSRGQQQLATTAAPSATSVAKNDTLQAQATSQNSSSSSLGSAGLSNNATQAKPEPEEKWQQKQAAGNGSAEQQELRPNKAAHANQSQRPQHLRSLYPSRPRGSMLIVSSPSSASPLLDPFQPMGSALPPFMALAPPSGQVMQLTLGGNELAAGIGPLNPILRSILSNVMSDISSSSSSPSADPLPARRTSGSQSKDRLLGVAATSSGEQAGGGDEDWPSSEFERSSWDEQPTFSANQPLGSPRQLKARHRAMMSSSGEDELDGSSDQEAGQQQPAHLASFLDRQLESGLLRQTIRGPGMSVERIIELPTGPTRMMKAGGSARQQQQQQQLSSRADDDGSGMMMMMEGEGEGERAPTFASRIDEPFPISAMSRLFADMRPMRSMQLVQGGGDEQPARDQRAQQLIKNRSIMSEDDESAGDSVDTQQASAEQQANRSPIWSPKIRIAGARLSMSRPAAAMLAAEQRLASSSAPETAILMPPPSAPMHFTIPASLDGNEAAEQHQQHHHHHDHDQQQQRQVSSGNRLASFEDTLNSMEDRLNHVLSVSSGSQQASGGSGSGSGSGAQDNNKQSVVAKQAAVGEPQKPLPAPMAYTSPSSPLFGFPVVQQQSVSGNRQQRSNSFTYHSNHELANQAPAKQEPEAPLQRSFMGPFSGPPASLVMGRRLDDGPAAAISEQQDDGLQQQHQQAAAGAGAGGASLPEIEATDESYRTIVV